MSVDATSHVPSLGRPQPSGLWLLASVELWERFSFYGMRALLVLFLIRAWHWSPQDAVGLYGTYTAMVYLAPLIGGYLADRWLGTARAMTVGGILIAAGHASLAIGGWGGFYAGLGLVVIGTGLFKPNVSTMVGQLYRPDDDRRDAGFTYFYMGINAGAFLSPLVCGYLGERWGWEWGFASAGVGMLASLALFLWGRRRWLVGIGAPPVARAARAEAPLTRAERSRVAALVILFGFVVLFWAGYEQAGSSLNLFADKFTNRVVGGFEIPTTWFQSIPPLAILIFGPVFALMWRMLGRRRWEPSAPYKMAAGLLLLALGFQVLAIGGARADEGALVSPWWLVAAFTLHVWGELCLSPVGLSLVSRTAPAGYASLLMAGWFLANSAGNKVAGILAARGVTVPQTAFFTALTCLAVAGSVTLLLTAPRLDRMLTGGPASGTGFTPRP